LPSDEECKILESELGMNSIELDQTYTARESGLVGKKLKSVNGWTNDGNGTDSYGFNGKPGGLRTEDGRTMDISNYMFFWTTRENNETTAYARMLTWEIDGIPRFYPTKARGISVRCVKDE
jgi:uncharacterized protein (TIGR02145 family)